jgi:hypothetical protein
MVHPAPIMATLIAMYGDVSLECLSRDKRNVAV